ncbi:polysaccharide biosynthesis tyrosine autokinase [Marivirga sp.]|uniref:GumC family protein n=1 Tax=Marivirga sp. TaxID=2018662 RepID=UPI0025EDE13B|nr:polysaccharide biosynthesis tyrosine autokinase [Marivirga sp.]
MKLSEILVDDSSKTSYKKEDIKDHINSYLKFWPLFIGSFLLIFSLVSLYLYYAIPYYSVNSSVMLKDNARGAAFVDNPVLMDMKEYQTSNIVDNEVDVLQSSILVKKVANDLKLYNNYFYLTGLNKLIPVFEQDLPFQIETIEIYPVIDGEEPEMLIKEFDGNFIIAEIDNELIKIPLSTLVNTKYAKFKISLAISSNDFDKEVLVKFRTPDQIASIISSQLDVETKDKNSSIIYLSLLETVPQRGVLILNELIDEYNLQSSDEKKEVAIKSFDFINSQIDLVLGELNSMEQQVESFKNTRNVVDIQTDSKFYQENFLINNKEIAEVQNQIDISNSIQEFITNNPNGDITGLSSLIKSDSYLFSLMQEYNSLVNEKSRLDQSVLEGSPLIVNLNRRRESSRKSILSHIENNNKALNITLRNLNAKNAQFQSKSSSSPRVERQYEEITRDLGIKKEHYLYLLQKKEETALFIASVPANHAKSIDLASFSLIPFKPNPPLIYLVSAFFAFVIPFAYAYSKNLLDNKVSNLADIKAVTEAEVLGELSYDGNSKLFAIDQINKTPISEQFRLIRSNFNFLGDSDSSKSILVTSSISGEGKTFFALNFAKSLSMIGKKVAVLEYDLRKEGLNGVFGLESNLGISDYLSSSNFTIDRLIQSGEDVNGITFFQMGNVPDNPAELMYSKKNFSLISKLKEKYDFVIIDTAPIGQVSDAFSLAAFVDYTIFMVRYDYSSKKNIHFFEDIIKSKKLVNPLIVLNGSKTSIKNTYGHYNYN